MLMKPLSVEMKKNSLGMKPGQTITLTESYWLAATVCLAFMLQHQLFTLSGQRSGSSPLNPVSGSSAISCISASVSSKSNT